jgi:hypothetical protein
MDVIPLPAMQWLARCDCGRTHASGAQEAEWLWLLDHECGLQPIDSAPDKKGAVSGSLRDG